MWHWLFVIVAVAAVLELAARALGLGSPLLYEKTGYGYRIAPGQSVTRFGNLVNINAFGLRGVATTLLPEPGVLRVLCIGDSITFGGSEVDQTLTYPSQLQDLLAVRGRVEVLIAASGGWAMENEEGWLEAEGIFGSRFVVLQVASHDLFQEKETSEIVGVHPSFPHRRPWFALQELWTRYLWPRLAPHLPFADPGVVIYSRTREDVKRNLASFSRISELVRRKGAELLVLFVEQPAGIEPEDPVTREAKEQFLSMLQSDGVPFVRTAEEMEQAGGKSLFRDVIHPNAEGNRVMAEQVALLINSRMQKTGPLLKR